MRKAGRKKKAAPVTLATVRMLAAHPTATPSRDAAPAPERTAEVTFNAVRESGGRVRIIGSNATTIIGGEAAVRIAPAPLDALAARQRLDEADPDRNRSLHAAGDRLRHHHYRAGLSGFARAARERLCSGGSGPSQSGTITETMEASRRAFYQAEAAMHAGDWAVVQAVVIEERSLEATGSALGLGARGSAVPVALDRLRRGLQILAERWGMLLPVPANVNASCSAGASAAIVRTPVARPVPRGCARARMAAGTGGKFVTGSRQRPKANRQH